MQILLRHSEAGNAGGVDEILAAHFQAVMNHFFFFDFPICFPFVLCIFLHFPPLSVLRIDAADEGEGSCECISCVDTVLPSGQEGTGGLGP